MRRSCFSVINYVVSRPVTSRAGLLKEGTMDEFWELLKSFLGIVFIVAVSFLIGTRYGHRKAGIDPESKVIRDTVTCTVYDTIVRYRPVFRYSYIRDTVRAYFTTVRHDTVLAAVPIERRVYTEDSLYRAVVSGWRPSLDSLTLFPKTTTITIREREVVPRSKWSVGATVGPSVLASPSGKVHAGIGVTAGVSYRF